jgi:3-hydroxybutyrate dehydrogenase
MTQAPNAKMKRLSQQCRRPFTLYALGGAELGGLRDDILRGNGMRAGKTAIVTGSTSGIGLGIATALAGQGANIVLNGFGPADEIEKIVSDLKRQHNIGVMYSSANIADPDEIEDMVDQTRAEFGAVDILVNNAGIQHVDPIEEFPVDKWNAIIAINLSGAFHTCRLAVPDMKKNGWGRIVNVASAHALVASPFKSAYVSAKHGLAGLTKTVALELAEHGVTANAICPGYVLTPLVQKQIPEQAKARGISEEAVMKDVLLAAQPTKQFVEVSQIAALTTFLCSDEAASITGTLLPIDGGWTAH